MNTTYETEDLGKLALGARAGRSSRLRRALVARLLNERAEGGDEENGDAGTEGGDEDERQLAKLLVGSRLLRRRRVRRLVLAHLLNARGEEGEDEFEDEDIESEDEGGDDDRSVARLLIGSRMLRRRRVRRVLLAHLIKQRGEAEDVEGESDEDFEDDEGGGDDGDRKFAKLVIGSRILRRRRVRRAVLAKLLNN